VQGCWPSSTAPPAGALRDTGLAKSASVLLLQKNRVLFLSGALAICVSATDRAVFSRLFALQDGARHSMGPNYRWVSFNVTDSYGSTDSTDSGMFRKTNACEYTAGCTTTKKPTTTPLDCTTNHRYTAVLGGKRDSR